MCYEEKKMNIKKNLSVYFAKPQCVGCNLYYIVYNFVIIRKWRID